MEETGVKHNGKTHKKKWKYTYSVFLCFYCYLDAFFIVITVKVAVSPVCSTDAQHSCIIDAWSLAGLTAAVFGIAATLLAFLGAFAVAYWWGTLNEKVDDRIEEVTTRLVEERIQTQEKKFQDLVANTVQTFNSQVSQLESSLQAVEMQLIISITQLDPWIIEYWARDLIQMKPSSEVALWMVRSYLRKVDLYINPSPPDELSTLRLAPENEDLICWEKALDWQKIVIRQGNQIDIDTVKWEIDRRTPLFEEYKKHRKKP